MNFSFIASSAFWRALGLTAVLTGTTWYLIPTDDLPIARDGYGWVAPKDGFRQNIKLNANARVPDIVWESETWRDEIGVDRYDNVFLVAVWVKRDGESHWTRVDEARVPAHRMGWLQFSTQRYELRPGDMIAVQDHAGLMVSDWTPFASVIDNVSNAPDTVPPMKVKIEPGPRERRRPVRP